MTEIYKPVKETAKWFKCRDCGEIQNYFEKNPYGASYRLCALLHRCRTCVQKISLTDEWFSILEKAKELKVLSKEKRKEK